MRFRATTPAIALAGAALLAAAVLLWAMLDDGPKPRAEDGTSIARPADVHRETAPLPDRDAARAKDPGASLSPDQPPERESLDALRRAVPPGKPEEYAVTRFAQNKRRPSWLVSIVAEVGRIDLFPEPPFFLRGMFGPSDRPWLERVQAAYRAALQERAAAAGYRDLATADDVVAEQIRSEVRHPFRRLLRDVARERFEASPELQARFFDPRPLTEMTVGSPEYYWLEEVLGMAWPYSADLVGLNDYLDKRYLTALDVAELVRIKLDIARAFREDEKRRMSRGEGLAVSKEHTVQLLRPFAERLQALVNARKPRVDPGGR